MKHNYRYQPKGDFMGFSDDKVQRNVRASGAIFGQLGTITGERIALLVQQKESLSALFMVQTVMGDYFMRLKPSQLRELRTAIDKALAWFDERDGLRGMPDINPNVPHIITNAENAQILRDMLNAGND